MTGASWLKKIWNGRSKGVSTVIGTVFLMLIIFMVSTNVLLWTFSQNAQYTQAAKDVNQEEADRHNENVVALGGNYSVSGDQVTVKVVLKNAGSVAAQIINLWVLDTNQSNRRYVTKSLNLNLNPGDVEPSWLTVTIPEADPSHDFASWFVTARGNTVPLEKEQEGVIVAELAQGIGSISMDFRQFRYYEVPNDNDGTDIGSPHYGFTIDSTKYTLLGVMLTNLDSSREAINLTGDSYIWAVARHVETLKSDQWNIRKVQDNKLASFDFQILEYGKPTIVYFGAAEASRSADKVVPINILLFGRQGESDYGQNLPFIALRVT